MKPVQAATGQVFFVLMERREAPNKKCYALSQCCSDEEVGLLRFNHNEGDYIGPICYGKANGLGKCVWSKGPLVGDRYPLTYTHLELMCSIDNCFVF